MSSFKKFHVPLTAYYACSLLAFVWFANYLRYASETNDLLYSILVFIPAIGYSSLLFFLAKDYRERSSNMAGLSSVNPVFSRRLRTISLLAPLPHLLVAGSIIAVEQVTIFGIPDTTKSTDMYARFVQTEKAVCGTRFAFHHINALADQALQRGHFVVSYKLFRISRSQPCTGEHSNFLAFSTFTKCENEFDNLSQPTADKVSSESAEENLEPEMIKPRELNSPHQLQEISGSHPPCDPDHNIWYHTRL